MTSATAQNNSNYQIGLNIHLLSFTLPPNLIKDREEVRVSITTMPELNKQHFYIHGKKMNCSNHVFAINITNATKHIVMVFRKKVLLSENPIIASKTIHVQDFQNFPTEPITSGTVSSDVKVLNIYYPLQQQKQEARDNRDNNGIHEKHIKRKILGQMQVQLSFTTPYIMAEKSKSKKNNNKCDSKLSGNKVHKLGRKDKKGDYQKINNENNNGLYTLL